MTVLSYKILIATCFFVGMISAAPLTILGAAYGKSDVSSQVRAAVKSNSLSITASNDVLGDTFFGSKKALVIVYRYGNDDPIVLVTQEGKKATITQQIATNLRGSSSDNSQDFGILGAAYGLADVTEKVQTLFGKGAKDIFADNSVFGDSWPNNKKTLVVVYASPSGNPVVKIAVEGEHVPTSIFRGIQ